MKQPWWWAIFRWHRLVHWLPDVVGDVLLLLYMRAHPTTAGGGEVVFCMVLLSGLHVILRNTNDAWGDLRFVKTHHPTPCRILIARGTLRREIMRAISAVLALLLGLLLLLASPRASGLANRYAWVPQAINIISPIALLGSLGLGVLANSYFDQRDRRLVLALLGEQAAQAEAVQALRTHLANQVQPLQPKRAAGQY